MAKFIEVNIKGNVRMVNIEHIASYQPFTDNGKAQTNIQSTDRWHTIIDEDYRSFTDRLSALAEISYKEDEQ